jgi:hypothetical protein
MSGNYNNPRVGEPKRRRAMAKKKAVKKATAKKVPAAGRAANVLPGMPGTFVVMGMSTSQNKKIAEALRKKLAGG